MPADGLVAQGIHADRGLREVFDLRDKVGGVVRASWLGVCPELVELAHEAELGLFVEGVTQHHERRPPLQGLQAHRAVDEDHTGRVLCQIGGVAFNHVVHAVGNALLKDKPDARVLYLHAEQFISDVVKNYQRKTFD